MCIKPNSLKSRIALPDRYVIFTPDVIRFLIKKAESSKNRESSDSGFKKISFIIEGLYSDYLMEKETNLKKGFTG